MTRNQSALPLPNTSSAVISACGRYRYVLTRRVGPGERKAAFIMLNPSTADASIDDPTIRRCIGFARQWGCGRLVVLNLFAFRATSPADLKRAPDPVGPENKAWFGQIQNGHKDGDLVICGWGVHGVHRGQDLAVLGWLAGAGVTPLALGVTKNGHPKHPLYVPYSADLLPFVGQAAMSWASRTAPIQIGDIVRYSTAWLRSTCQYTGDIPHARGTVTELKVLSPEITLAVVDWGGNPEIPTRVNVKNLQQGQRAWARSCLKRRSRPRRV